jgi:hypothetical protein
VHTSEPGHTLPQKPQFFGSLCVSTHKFEHFVVPPLQSSAHWPPEQTSPTGHALPHEPQFAGSFSTSTHLSAHCVEPPLHTLDVHVPETHDCPLAHFAPHEPQLFGSNCVTVQVFPHIVAPLPHPPGPPSPLFVSSMSEDRTPHAAKTIANKAKNQSRLMNGKRTPRGNRVDSELRVNFHNLTVVRRLHGIRVLPSCN